MAKIDDKLNKTLTRWFRQRKAGRSGPSRRPRGPSMDRSLDALFPLCFVPEPGGAPERGEAATHPS